jgi:Ca-activated chloride channel family protein
MFRKIFTALVCACLCLAFPPSRLRARSAQEKLRVDVNLVNVFVTVQNSNGEYVTGLPSDAFRIYEDDVQQKISIFEKEERVESAIGILMDTSGSNVDILPIMKTGVLDFAQKARRSDEFFVMTFGIRAQLIQDFHQSVQNLEYLFKTLQARGNCVLFDAMLDGMKKVGTSERARKALIVFTDGQDNGSKAGYGDTSMAAQRSSVLLYFIPIGSRIHVDQPAVDSLAKLSGGRVIYLEKTDPIRPAMEAIRKDLASQYYLGYYAPLRPGLHHIRVELPGYDYRTRSKTGYMGN